MSQILIDHDNALLCPSQRSRPVAQRVLASCTFGILQDLRHRYFGERTSMPDGPDAALSAARTISALSPFHELAAA
jgi:hypothetical protein